MECPNCGHMDVHQVWDEDNKFQGYECNHCHIAFDTVESDGDVMEFLLSVKEGLDQMDRKDIEANMDALLADDEDYQP